jgi:hypothetical protein
MITDRDFLRAEADYLRPPTERDVCECEQCGALDVEVNPATARHAFVLSVDEGALICGDCATGADNDAERDAWDAAVRDLAMLSLRWHDRGGRPSRRHFREVDTARAECATGVATRAQGWVSL